ELNAALIADLAGAVGPVLTLVHKELDGAALLAGRPFIRFGGYTPSAADADPQDDLFRSMPRDVAPESLRERNEAAEIAGIFCTSGTTARPKIVVYDHCAYWLNGLSTLECLGLTENDRTLEYRSFGWNSAQVLSLMPFLETGLTMHIARRFSHSHFFEWIQQYGITFAAGVPTVLNMLLNKPLPSPPRHPSLRGEGQAAEGSPGWGGGGAAHDTDAAYAEALSPPPGPLARADLPPPGGGETEAGEEAKDLPTWRLMSCSTAPLTARQWSQFEEMYGVRLLQMYGMSEAGWVCGNGTYKNRVGTVGMPALHQEFAIVDADGRPCPPGVEGEVTAGGPQTAVGYLLDDGTIEPIRPNRIKTGDLAIEDPDGFIRITGRIKDL